MYYIYLASVYGVQILRTIFTKFTKGYSRGFVLHFIGAVQLFVQFVIVVVGIQYENSQRGSFWILWELILFILFFGTTIIVRSVFVFLIFLQVLNKNNRNMELKQAYWFLMTTK